MNERFGDTTRRAKVHQQIHAHVKLWRQPFDACIPHAREAARVGLEAGDFAYAGYGAATETWPAFLASRDLSQFVRDYSPALAFLARINMSGFRDALRVMLNWALALQGRTSGTVSLSNESLDEEDFIARYAATATLFMTMLRCAKLHLCVIFDETALGLEAVERAREVTIPGTMWPVLEDFWGALALAAAYETADPDERALPVTHRRRGGFAERTRRQLPRELPLLFTARGGRTGASVWKRARARAVRAGRGLRSRYRECPAGGTGQRPLRSNAPEARRYVRRDAPHVSRARAYGAWGALAKVQQMRRHLGQLLSRGR